LRYILVTTRDGKISGFEEAKEVVVYDIEEGKIARVLSGRVLLDAIEDLVEELDAWIMFTRSISSENRELIEESGIKTVVTTSGSIEEILREYFTG